MSRVLYITGVSSGIGFACARFFLDKGYTVVGIGRRCTLQEANFHFVHLDMSDTKNVAQFTFPVMEAKEPVLINNAGIIGEIDSVWQQTESNIEEVCNVNIVAPYVLSQKFITTFEKGTILNISSGAAQRPIKGWAAYCASKAALDMISLTLQEELDYFQKNFVVKSIAPGVVDTAMQNTIRKAPIASFPDSQNFHDLHQEGQLESPNVIAKKLDHVIHHINLFPETVFSLRDATI